jgi:hypothetical protein
MRGNEVVSADRLVEDLWAGRPPASAAKVLQGYRRTHRVDRVRVPGEHGVRRRRRSNRLDVTVPGATNGGSTLTTTRHFNTVQDIQNQMPDARVWLGFHFRNSVRPGSTRPGTPHAGGSFPNAV